MKTKDINENLVGKKVKGIFTGLEVTGTITKIVEGYSKTHPKLVAEGAPEYTLCSKGVKIHLDRPVRWGDSFYTEYESTARVADDWGNLQHTELLEEPTAGEIEAAYQEAAYHEFTASGGCRD